MFTAKLKRKNGKIEQSDFKTLAERDAWVADLRDKKYFGKDAHTVEHAETELAPAWTEYIPAEYDLEFIDNSAEEEVDRVKKEGKKNKRAQRMDTLKSTDWSNVKTIAELKALVKTLAEEILKDEA